MSSHTEPALQKKEDYILKKPHRMAMNVVNRAWTFLTAVPHTGTKSVLQGNNWQFSWLTKLRQILSALHTTP